MRILYVSQYFPPEMGAPSARVYELSREWAARGHRVTVLTAFPNHPTGVKRPEDKFRIFRREEKDGIEILRSYIYAAANKGKWKRMACYASFMLSASVIGALAAEKPEVVIATSPQLLCAAAGWFLARRFRVPFVFEVRDLWPESVIAVEAMSENALVRALKKLAAFLYDRADKIVAVGEGYRNQIHARYQVPLSKMEVIPNGVDLKLFNPLPKNNPVREELGLSDKFVVMYIGTHGMAHALDKVLAAARELKNERDIMFVFVGEGAEKENLLKLQEQWKLENVRFVPQQPKERIPLYYAAGDVGLVPLKNTPLFQEVLPSKIFEYLAMERPIIISVDGQARKVAEQSGGGVFVPPEDPHALAEAVRNLARDRDRLEVMGKKGREFVTENFNRKALADKYLELLSSLV